MQLTGSVVVVHGLSCSVACGTFPGTWDQTHGPCIGRQILIHCTTREVLHILKNVYNLFLTLLGLCYAGYSLVALYGLLFAVASLVVGHGLSVVVHRLLL